MIRVSVVVPVFNNNGIIRELLESLEAQTFDKRKCEFLIVDNNSSDNTGQIVTEFIARHPQTNIQLLHEQVIQSSYAARNKGVRASKGSIIAFTDSDCLPRPDWLEKLVSSFDRNDRAGVVGGEILAFHGSSLIERFSEEGNVLSQTHSLKNGFKPFFQTANVAYRKSVFEQAGLFRSHLKTGGDADMCWRAQMGTDLGIEFCKEAVVLHKHRTNLSDLREQFTRYGRSSVYLNLLYSVPVDEEPSSSYFMRKVLTYIVIKLPILAARSVLGRSTTLDLCREPLRLYARWCRKNGIRIARKTGLPGNLTIEYLS